MTLLGAGATFSMGSNTSPTGDEAMTKSLDDLIKDRRKQQQQESKRGPKKPSTVDQSIATGRAKREAAVKQRRGLSNTKKPTAMEVDKQVSRQTEHTAKEKQIKEKKATQGRVAPDSTARNKKKKAKAKANKPDPPAPIFGGRTPPKKAIEAALKGMETAGYKVPQGHTVVMTYVPVVIPAATIPVAKEPSKAPEAKGKKGGPAKKKGNTNGQKKN